MKYLLCFFLLISFVSQSQPIKEINFRYLYDNTDSYIFHLKPVREATQWRCFYELISRDSTSNLPQISWEVRSSVGDPEGEKVAEGKIQKLNSAAGAQLGHIEIPISETPKFLVAILNKDKAQKRTYYALLDPKYPTTDYIKLLEKPVVSNYIKINSDITLSNGGTYSVAFYDDSFPTAPLAFSEAVGKVPKQMKVDSSFTVPGGQSVLLPRTGLYLFQRDTTATEGIALRVEDDYPKYTKLKSIADPLVYICTSQEFAKIKQSKGEKKAFDRVILSITKDSERAKTMMRNYFKRVETANELFTSYKEGWKTDRGMIYIIFGLPDEVFRYADREVWNYKGEYKVTFDFVKAPSLFDPENHVLIRNRKYAETWYGVVDLWRNARF